MKAKILKLLFVFTLLLTQTVAQANDWKQLLKFNTEDIKIIEQSPQRDLEIWIRLFELYAEKHSLLLLGQNELEVESFTNKSKIREFKKIRRYRQRTLRKLLKISRKVAKKAKKNKELLAKIYYFEALSYYLISKENKFHEKIKLAEKYATSAKYKKQIYAKLGDYYFNKKKYVDAKKYYLRLLKLPKDKWYPKYLYNLSWVYFKYDNLKQAVKLVKKSYYYSSQDGFADFREQVIDSVLLFFASSDQITAGVYFLRQRDQDSFDNLLKFLHYTFEHGKKKNSEIIVDELKETEKDDRQKVILLTKEILVYRTVKKYQSLQNELEIFKPEELNLSKIPKADVDTLINDLKGYTGLLQSLVKNIKGKRQKSYSKYISDNFDLLSKLDPAKKMDYEFFKGETYFATKEYHSAIKHYQVAIDIYMKSEKKDKGLANKVFDSYFKSLEYLKKDKNYNATLRLAFDKYLEVFPKGRKSLSIHKRLIGLYFSENDLDGVPKAVARFTKAYPKMKKLQKSYYNQLINKYSDQKNIEKLLLLKEQLPKANLGFGAADVRKINTIVYQLKLRDALEKVKKTETEEEGLKELVSLLNNKECDRDIRINAAVQILKYHFDHNNQKELSSHLKSFYSILNKKEMKTHIEKIKFYTTKLCETAMFDYCLEHLSFVREKTSFSVGSFLEETMFKLLISEKKFTEAHKLIRAKKVRKEYFKQALLISQGDSLAKFLNGPEGILYKDTFNDELDEIAWIRFFNNKFGIQDSSLGDYANISYISKKEKEFNQKFDRLKKNLIFADIKMPTPKKEGGEVTFEMFSKFLERFLQDFQYKTGQFNTLIKDNPAQFSLFIINEYIRDLEKNITQMEGYEPITKEVELKKAIVGELGKLVNVLDKKKSEYVQLKLKTSRNSEVLGGAGYFNQSLKAGSRLTSDLQRYLLWKE